MVSGQGGQFQAAFPLAFWRAEVFGFDEVLLSILCVKDYILLLYLNQIFY